LQRHLWGAHEFGAARGGLPNPLLSLRKVVFLVEGLAVHLDQADPDLVASRRRTGDATALNSAKPSAPMPMTPNAEADAARNFLLFIAISFVYALLKNTLYRNDQLRLARSEARPAA